MKLSVDGGAVLRGSLSVPGDKSISHRAVLFGAMAQGRTEIRGLLRGEDVLATLAAVQQLGAEVEELGGVLHVRGAAWRDVGLLDCGNSGTTARLMLGALAGRASATLDGDSSLRRRPMRRVTEPLAAMGAHFEGGPGLPLQVARARLHGIDWTAKVASAQVKSAILLAGLHAEGPTRYHEPLPTRDHSERMLRAMGATLTCQEQILHLEPGILQGVRVDVPGDISSAAFWMVAASILPGSELILEGVGLNPTRTGVLDVLLRMGADIEILRDYPGSEPRADLRVRAAHLHGTHIGGAEIPRLIDEVPVLAVAAAFAEGESRITDAAELRVKESDRIATTLRGLHLLGVEAQPLADGLIIAGGRPTAASSPVPSEGDHRIAMAFAVAGLAVGAQIEDVGNVATSYPTFFDHLRRLGAEINLSGRLA